MSQTWKAPPGKAGISHSIYPYLPPWLQSIGISLYGIAYRHERLGGGFDTYVAEFRERDRWPVERMQSYLRDALRRTLEHAFVQCPYYRDKWAAAGITLSELGGLNLCDLPRIPITLKVDLRLNPESFVAENVRRRGGLHRYYTSGSTGTPVTCICDADAHRKFLAAREVRSFGWAGTSIRMGRSMIGGRMVVPQADARPPYYRYNWAERQVYCSAFHISASNLPSYLEAFHRYRPELFTGYASSHCLLGRLMLARGVRLEYTPKALVLSSEKLSEPIRVTLRETFRARAYEEYGSVENCVLATECEYGSLHVNPDFGIVEIIDEHGEPVPPGREGRIVCTGLVNDVQPLIRYEIGDIGAWSSGGCRCGRGHLPVLQEIAGRIEDALIGPDGREVVRFHGIPLHIPQVLECQIVQDSLDSIRVRVVATEALDGHAAEVIRERVRERLGRVRVAVERVETLERSTRGKLRAVVCNLSEAEKRQALAATARNA